MAHYEIHHIDLFVFADVPDTFYTATATLAERHRPVIRQMKRMNDSMNYTVDDFEGIEERWNSPVFSR